MQDIEHTLSEYREVSDKYGKAKGTRVYLEEFKKSKHAILMRKAEQAGHKTVSAQEREAYADDEYMELLKALGQAVEEEEWLRYRLRCIEATIEVWRTIRADERMERKAYGA